MRQFPTVKLSIELVLFKLKLVPQTDTYTVAR